MTQEPRRSGHPIGILVAATIGNFLCLAPTVQSVFGLFLIPIAGQYGWTRAQVSAALAIIAVMNALFYPVAGRFADRWGGRPVILAANLAFGLSVVGLTLSGPHLPLFYLLFAVLGVSSAFFSTMVFNKLVAGWFNRARGRALGLSAGFGNGAGSTVMPVLAEWLMIRYGWRGAWQIIGLLVVAIGMPVLAGWLRDAPEEPAADRSVGTGMTLAQAALTRVFWTILLAIAIGAGCMMAVFTHVIPVLTDRHVAVGEAATVVSMFGFVCAGWQAIMGWLIDKSPSPKVAAPFYLIAVAGLILLQNGSGAHALLASGAMMGIGLGTEFGVLPYLIARYFGLRSYGAIAGVMYSVVTIATGFMPLLMDISFGALGSYRGAFYWIELALLAGAALLASLPRYEILITSRLIRLAQHQ